MRHEIFPGSGGLEGGTLALLSISVNTSFMLTLYHTCPRLKSVLISNGARSDVPKEASSGVCHACAQEITMGDRGYGDYGGDRRGAHVATCMYLFGHALHAAR